MFSPDVVRRMSEAPTIILVDRPLQLVPAKSRPLCDLTKAMYELRFARMLPSDGRHGDSRRWPEILPNELVKTHDLKDVSRLSLL